MGTPQSASVTYSSCRVCTSEASSPASKRSILQDVIRAKQCSKGASSVCLVLSLRISLEIEGRSIVSRGEQLPGYAAGDSSLCPCSCCPQDMPANAHFKR